MVIDRKDQLNSRPFLLLIGLLLFTRLVDVFILHKDLLAPGLTTFIPACIGYLLYSSTKAIRITLIFGFCLGILWGLINYFLAVTGYLSIPALQGKTFYRDNSVQVFYIYLAAILLSGMKFSIYSGIGALLARFFKK
jgi:hypothetical protein